MKQVSTVCNTNTGYDFDKRLKYSMASFVVTRHGRPYHYTFIVGHFIFIFDRITMP